MTGAEKYYTRVDKTNTLEWKNITLVENMTLERKNMTLEQENAHKRGCVGLLTLLPGLRTMAS